jgi:hypothetical protein
VIARVADSLRETAVTEAEPGDAMVNAGTISGFPA